MRTKNRKIKITNAAYFPQPQAIYKEKPIARVLGKKAAEYMRAWEYNGLWIIATAAEYDDGKEWLHVSVSRKSRVPKGGVCTPEKKNHVNIHDYCLHLFYSAENPLPEFSAGMGTI